MVDLARTAFRCLVLLALAAEPIPGAENSVSGLNSEPLCVSGDRLFRQSRFEEAERAYATALAANSVNARAHWGLGRIAALRGNASAARDHIAIAYRLDPRDPEIVLSYADYAAGTAARCVLLRNYLALAGPGDRSRREDILSRLEIAERLGDREIAALASPYQHYHFALAGFFPDGRMERGVLLKVRIGGGRPLSLVLDTGADGITVASSRVRAAHLPMLVAGRVEGLDEKAGLPTRVALADSVSIGELRLENCLVQLADREFVPGADGVIGTNLFQNFLLRLDVPGRTLDLLPFSGSAEESQASEAAIYRLSHLILVRVANPDHNRYFLFDTGSSFSAIAGFDADRPTMPGTSVRDVAGNVIAPFHLPPMHLVLAGTDLVDRSPVVLDLRQVSQTAGAEITGIAGFPLFRKSVFVLDYRNQRIRFEK